MRVWSVMAIILLPLCGATWATDVVIEVEGALSARQRKALMRKYNIEAITDVPKFGFIRLHAVNPPSSNAESALQQLRKENGIRQADISPTEDHQIMLRTLRSADLSARQRRVLDRVQVFAPRSIVVLSRQFGFVRLILANSVKARQNETQPPKIAMAPGLTVAAAETYVEESSSHLTWSGVTLRRDIPADGHLRSVAGTAELSVFRDNANDQAQIWGRFVDTNELVLIRPMGDGSHLVIRLDRNRDQRAAESPVGIARAAQRNAKAMSPTIESGNAADTTCQPVKKDCRDTAAPPCDARPRHAASRAFPTIKLGVLLNKGTSDDRGVEIERYSKHIIGQLNSAFARSCVEAQAVISRAEERTFHEPSNKDDYVKAFSDCDAFYSGRGGTCPLKEIYDWRNETESDLVLILSRSEARENFAAGHTKNLAFAVIQAEWAETVPPDVSQAEDDLIALHEIGHVLGGEHELQWYEKNPNEPRDVLGKHGHGYVREVSNGSTHQLVCTIMSQGDRCSRQLYWSTPKVAIDGISIGSCEKEDVARLISERANCISQFHEFVQTAQDASGEVIEGGNRGQTR